MSAAHVSGRAVDFGEPSPAELAAFVRRLGMRLTSAQRDLLFAPRPPVKYEHGPHFALPLASR